MKRDQKDTAGDGKSCTVKHGMTFPAFCKALGKSAPYIHNLQTKLGLYIPGKGEDYSSAYLAFMQIVVSLRTFSIPVDDICRLFETEKKLLKLLKIDSLTHSRTWYLDTCGSTSGASNRLLLTNYEIDPHIKPNAIQSNLDFGPKEKELFSGHEMGEDARRVFDVYQRQHGEIIERVRTETPVLERALDWLISVTQ
ncbi:MAG: hypothetical protein PHR77_02285 [Kiritimatiellae bacterium]|nr:hypothetical protein [Kiritimatiellia bacterium]MDD5521796.1 hypothetical protein [Kiritimatiellia bacterium]